MTEHVLAPMHSWLAEPLAFDVAHSIENLRRADDVRHVAVMPDVHLAAGVCVGVVVATQELLYPQAIGGDIGCGMAAVAFDADASAIDHELGAAHILAGLYENVPSNRLRHKVDLPAGLSSAALSDPRLQRAAERDGRVQLGTLGRGNHFIEFQADAAGRLWLMVHSGSRGVGQLIAKHHLELCRSGSGGLSYLEANSAQGEAFMSDAAWAETYAQENRLRMIQEIETVIRQRLSIDIDWVTLMDRVHNQMSRETHFGQSWYVHRKGAQSIPAGESGMIPGSMGTVSLHVAGRGNRESLHSCSHGAGRRMSRAWARHSTSVRELSRQLSGIWFDRRRAAALRDEAPSAYKNIHDVMRTQHELVRTERELRPVLSYKGV